MFCVPVMVPPLKVGTQGVELTTVVEGAHVTGRVILILRPPPPPREGGAGQSEGQFEWSSFGAQIPSPQ